MPWPVHPTGFFGARGDNDTYRIERSLRFNSADSAYLNRTPASAGNRKTWTWSGWVKRGLINASFRTLFGVNNGTGSSYFALNINNGESLACSDNANYYRVTTQLFRDPSAWYHIVCSVDTTDATANNRIRFYVNGSEITSFSTLANPTQNADLGINQAAEHGIGRIATDLRYFDGYLTEIHFIDGQALTPSSFGETDAITGRWKAKAYSGTYGTNGFYLKFADNSSTAALGTDSSGNGNTWTPNNFSVTAGADNDSLVDSPTNYGIDTGVGGEVRGNYCTINPLKTNSSITISDGNLKTVKSAASNNLVEFGSVGVNTGKWYWEVKPTSIGGFYYIGIGKDAAPNNTYPNANDVFTYGNNGSKYNGASEVAYGSSFTANDVIGIELDCNSGTLVFYKNNTSQGTAFSSGISGNTWFPYAFPDGSNNSHTTEWNFGQRPFAYTAPTGFKALCTTNLTQPVIQKPSKYMDVVTYTGTGANQTISVPNFTPDIVWIKSRGAATNHRLYDSTRGTNYLVTNSTADEVASGTFSFSGNGFIVGTDTDINTSGTQYVAWSWDEAPIAGMDIVSYTGNGANRTIAHGLGVAPKMMIVKARVTASTDQGWPVYHTGVASDAETDYLLLNSTAAAADLNTVWNDTAPTSSVFSVGTNALVNTSNDTYIAYLFAEVEGFSKFGSYTGNGSADGPFVWCGFRPRWILFKASSVGGAGYNWGIYDTARDTFNVFSNGLYSNLADAESGGAFGDMLSNGFKLRNSSPAWNSSGQTYIFAAFAESPFKYARAR